MLMEANLTAVAEKVKQMEFAAEVFLKMKPEFRAYDPILSVADVGGKDFLVKEWFPLG